MRKEILIVLMVVILCSCSNKNKPTLTITDKDVVVEYGDKEFDINSLIVWGNFDDLSITIVDVFKVGKQEITFTALKDGEKVELTKEIEIVDTKYPKIDEIKKEITINQGQEFNVNDYVIASDPVEGRIKVHLSSDIDVNQPGDYSREVVARDSNGNEAREVISITVRGNISTNNGGNGGQSNTSSSSSNAVNGNSQSGSVPSGTWTEVYEESWSSSGSYEVDSNVTVEHKVQ